MGVLSVAEDRDLLALEPETLREDRGVARALDEAIRERLRDRVVVGRRAGECLHGEDRRERLGEVGRVVLEGIQEPAVRLGRREDDDVPEGLRGRAEESDAPYVDLVEERL